MNQLIENYLNVTIPSTPLTSVARFLKTESRERLVDFKYDENMIEVTNTSIPSSKNILKARLKSLFQKDISFQNTVRNIVETDASFKSIRDEYYASACVNGGCKNTFIATNNMIFDGTKEAKFQLSDKEEVLYLGNKIQTVNAINCTKKSSEMCFDDTIPFKDKPVLDVGDAVFPMYRLQFEGDDFLVQNAFTGRTKTECAKQLCAKASTIDECPNPYCRFETNEDNGTGECKPNQNIESIKIRT